MTGVTETTFPERGRGSGDKGVGCSRETQRGYKGPELLHLVSRSFTEQPDGSNLIEQLLSIVIWPIEMRFLIGCGEIRAMLRHKEGVIAVAPVIVRGRYEPLPTIMDEGAGK
jgi:hypothetical protein